jgi:hypothetical protein
MSIHEKAEYQILLDRASNYIVTHAAAAGLDVLPPIWDEGSPTVTTSLHRVRIATSDGEVDLPIPHDWLPLDSEGHNRFRTQVENALAQLNRLRRRSTQ